MKNFKAFIHKAFSILKRYIKIVIQFFLHISIKIHHNDGNNAIDEDDVDKENEEREV